jgi:glutamate dehydrogenase
MAQAATTDRLEPVLSVLRAESPDQPSPVQEYAKLLLARASDDFLGEATPEETAREVTGLFSLLEETGPEHVSVRVRPLDRAHLSVIETVMPDRSFIVNTLREYAHGRELDIPHLLHPVVGVRRGADGQVLGVGPRSSGGVTTSTVYMVVEGQLEEEDRASMQAELAERLETVRLVNDDFEAMLARSAETIAQLEREKQILPWRGEELQEIQDLLTWLQDGNFVFLGYRSYGIEGDEGGERWIHLETGSGLGILRAEADSTFKDRQKLSELPPTLRARVLGGPLLIISKTNSEAPIHRFARMDYIGVKRIGTEGEVVGERRFLGLFTSKAYNQDASEIPILRRKLREIVETEGAERGSHDYRIIFDFFGSTPLEELFLSSVSELSDLLSEIMETEGADEVRVTARSDPLGRGANVMVILPKQRFSGETRRRIQEALVTAYHGTLLNYHLALGEGDQARLHFYIASDPAGDAEVDVEALEKEVQASVRTWEERLSRALKEAHEAEDAHRLAERHCQRFSAEYTAMITPEKAVGDIDRLEALSDTGRPQVVFEELEEPRSGALLLKVFASSGQLVLSDAMPVLEHFGFRVIQADRFDLSGPDAAADTIHTFEVETPAEWELNAREAQPRVEEAVWAIIDRRTESDILNSLILSAGLEWRDVALLRAYAGYAFRSTAVGSRTGGREPLVQHPDVAPLLVSLFRARFDPRWPGDREEEIRKTERRFDRALGAVRSIEHDRTFRRLLALVQATVRTNFFQPAAQGLRSTIALKFECSKVEFLPRPRPRIEVYVDSPYTEGAHLRMGSVARGGIRWSDRHEDFRVEVLGLVKTQQVKNALIVPGGAKGAFIVKTPPPDGLSMREAAVDSYKEFIGALLDLSDNLQDGAVTHPAETARWDGDDPYLVVAADKGTATLSDTANERAADRGFWLGDAFASGGSQGYDHKALGITAKGAWECVKRHFRELGIDIQTEAFTVAGIGDMSGDVFGNGMLLSRQIRLLAAFDHRHIFLDPDPDPEASWEERKRLFEAAGSSWADYDSHVLSEGGGVYERGAKKIDLSPAARASLQLEDPDVGDGSRAGGLNGEDVVRAILKAPVDLLWNGGIGTYVKASDETHADVGDPNNDGVRVDASQLRTRVVGEGGNLGFTQRARIEYALAGGRINTDAIDNSGGVDLSDHEVNLKILLNAPLSDGRIDADERNRLLQEVAEDVVEDVLENSRSQSLALSLDERRAREGPDEFHDTQTQLERIGLLDRDVEVLPDADRYAERIDEEAFFTRPELAALLAYAKMQLKSEVQRSARKSTGRRRDAVTGRPAHCTPAQGSPDRHGADESLRGLHGEHCAPAAGARDRQGRVGDCPRVVCGGRHRRRRLTVRAPGASRGRGPCRRVLSVALFDRGGAGAKRALDSGQRRADVDQLGDDRMARGAGP